MSIPVTKKDGIQEIFLNESQKTLGATNGCATVCLYIAKYFMLLRDEFPINPVFVERYMECACFHWKKNIKSFQTDIEALRSNSHLKLRLRHQFKCRAYDPKIPGIVDSLYSYLLYFYHPLRKSIAIITNKDRYTFLLFFHKKCKRIVFFDSHGENARLIYFNSIEMCVNFLHTVGIHDNTHYEINWIRQKIRPRKTS